MSIRLGRPGCRELVLVVAAPSAWPRRPARRLGTLAIPMGSVSAAQPVARGAFVPPGPAPAAAAQAVYAGLPAFCRVTATLTPTSDSDIKAEIWLPAIGWNGKFLAVGNGGWAGTIPYAAIAAAVAAGYAGAGTDTGHVGNNADFALGHPEKLIDSPIAQL